MSDVPKVIKQLSKEEMSFLITVHATMHERNKSLYACLRSEEIDMVNESLYQKGIVNSKFITHQLFSCIWYSSIYYELSDFGQELSKVLYEIDRL